jgi:hypothetical protein
MIVRLCRLTLVAVIACAAAAGWAQPEPGAPPAAPTLADLLEAEDAANAAAAPPGATATSAKQPVPPAAERTAALGRVREIFGDDMQAAKSSDAKTAVAGKLIHYVDEASDRATHYVLLETARRLGIEACDIELARDAGRRMADTYSIDSRALEADALKAMAGEAPVAKLGAVVDALVEASRGSLANAPALAEELALAASSAARRAKDRERGAAAAQVLAEVREVKKREAKTKPLQERLKESPNDGEAALELGMIRCFEEQNWDDGLRYLTLGSDAALALVAKQDITTEFDPGRRLAAADAWWDYGKSQKGATAAAALQRARSHYTAALETAKGLDRARIEKRLETLDGDLAQKRPASAWTPKTLAGLTWWLDASDPATVKLSGATVSQWVDKSGAGRTFAQTEAKHCPAYRGQINGRKTITFDGSDDYLKLTAPNEALCDASGAAMFIVFKPDDDSDFSVYGTSGPTLNNQGRDRFTDGKTYHCYFRQLRMDGMAGVLSPTGLTLLTSRTQAVGNQTLRVNGQVVQSQPNVFTTWRASAGEAAGDVSNKVHTIGVNLAPADYFKGQIAEVIMYGRQLSDQEVATVERNLKAKWGTP